MQFLLFYSPKPRSQVRILIYRNWAIDDLNLEPASHFQNLFLIDFFNILKPISRILGTTSGQSIHYCILETTSEFKIQIIGSLCNLEGYASLGLTVRSFKKDLKNTPHSQRSIYRLMPEPSPESQ